jgi:hypothetical protein
MESTRAPPLTEPNHFRLAEQQRTRWSGLVARIEKGSGKEAANKYKNDSVPKSKKSET